MFFWTILFILNSYVNGQALNWEPDLTLNEYRDAGMPTGYKVFYKITDDCAPEDNYNYSVDVGDQLSLELLDNDYFLPGRNYKFQIKSYAVIQGMVYESNISDVVGCFKPRPLTGVEQLNLQEQQGLKKKSKTRENR